MKDTDLEGFKLKGQGFIAPLKLEKLTRTYFESWVEGSHFSKKIKDDLLGGFEFSDTNGDGLIDEWQFGAFFTLLFSILTASLDVNNISVKCSKLRILQVSWLGLKEFPNFITSLSSLTELNIKGNNFVELPKELGRPVLKKIWV